MSALRQPQHASPLPQEADARPPESEATIYRLPDRPSKVPPRPSSRREKRKPSQMKVAVEAKPTLPMPKPPLAILYRPDCVLRPPDWRWHRAWAYGQDYKNRRRKFWRAARQDGAGRVLGFRRRLAKCYDPMMRERVAEADPELYQAHAIYELPEHGPLRMAVESFLLAAASTADVTRETGLAPGVVEEYQRTFYDVSDRLGSPSLVLHLVGGGKFLCEPHHFVRYLSFFGGIHVAKRLIRGGFDEKRSISQDQVSQFLDENMLEVLQTKAALAVHLLDVGDRKAATRLVKMWIDLQRLQIKREQRKSQHGQLHTLTARRARGRPEANQGPDSFLTDFAEVTKH